MAQKEGSYVAWPLYFDGTHYNYWEAKMKIFLELVYFDLYVLVKNGYDQPTITNEGILLKLGIVGLKRKKKNILIM